jgi:hypothetical protein
MNGIYLTEQGKQEIEVKIAELETELKEEMNPFIYTSTNAALDVYNKILSSATILSVYESLGHAMQNKDLNNPNGVIIQPKK